MNPNQRGAKRNTKSLRLWTPERARAALPYVIPVLRSLREHWLEKQRHLLKARRLEERPGRPNREALIAHQEALRDARHAEERCDEAVTELKALHIKCLDPVRGQALFPFVHRRRLAWLLFNLFEDEPLRFWRFKDDPDDVRRPLEANEEDAPDSFTVA